MNGRESSVFRARTVPARTNHSGCVSFSESPNLDRRFRTTLQRKPEHTRTRASAANTHGRGVLHLSAPRQNPSDGAYIASGFQDAQGPSPETDRSQYEARRGVLMLCSWRRNSTCICMDVQPDGLRAFSLLPTRIFALLE